MHSLRLSNVPAGWLLLVSSALVAAAVWAEAHTPGKNGLDTLPLAWLLVEVCAPLLSMGCLVALCCRARRSTWLIFAGTLLTVPQCIVWFFAVGGVLYYLGIIR
jgi:hypothetical protein